MRQDCCKACCSVCCSVRSINCHHQCVKTQQSPSPVALVATWVSASSSWHYNHTKLESHILMYPTMWHVTQLARGILGNPAPVVATRITYDDSWISRKKQDKWVGTGQWKCKRVTMNELAGQSMLNVSLRHLHSIHNHVNCKCIRLCWYTSHSRWLCPDEWRIVNASRWFTFKDKSTWMLTEEITLLYLDIWISRFFRFSRTLFWVMGTHVTTCLKIWGLPRKRVWYVRGLPWNFFEILAVVVILSLTSPVRGDS